jgi:hypothetical protein
LLAAAAPAAILIVAACAAAPAAAALCGWCVLGDRHHLADERQGQCRRKKQQGCSDLHSVPSTSMKLSVGSMLNVPMMWLLKRLTLRHMERRPQGRN